jgi:hypothetical protein
MEKDKTKDWDKELKKWKSPQEIANYANTLVEMDFKPTYDQNLTEEYKVSLRVDETISSANFRSDPLIPGGFVANSLTIRAMRKDLFVLDSDMTELEEIFDCKSCRKKFDLQFWALCPYCGS